MPSESGTSQPGVLYVVGTPIGNLGDITLRAVEILHQVDTIAAEDTRHTRKLLTHLGIQGKTLVCVEAHVSAQRIDALVEDLRRGRRVALVTDAGMPSVSDPGAQLVTRCRQAQLKVVVVPGPSAVTAALAISGCVEGPFWFVGFLPRQGGRRLAILNRIEETTEPVVLFESPGRVHRTLLDLAAGSPHRTGVVCRELTKIHEEVVEGSIGDLAELAREWRGEVVVVLGPQQERALELQTEVPPSDEELRSALASGESVKDVLQASGLRGSARRALYARLVALRGPPDSEPR